MNLRFLTLVMIALESLSFEKLKTLDVMSDLITFIIDKNINGFRNILESKESFFIQIPDVSQSNKVNQN